MTTSHSENDYERDVHIDETALDVAWLEQAGLTRKYAKLAANASYDLDVAKQELDSIRARMDTDIRTDPDAYGLKKATNEAVINLILQSEDYKEAEKALFSARYELNMAQGAVRAMGDRKAALENLVRLHGQQYFAGPVVPRDLTKERENDHRRKKTDAGVANRLKRTK